MSQPVAIAVALYVAYVQALHAQESVADTVPVYTLPQLEVTATGLGWAAQDMAAPVNVLEGPLWQQQRAATLGESLDGELGIHATHFGAGASRPVVRGMDGPRVGVLANGMELHDASTISPDHAVVTEPLLAERVEILRGPAALVQGGAVGGVVNIVDQKVPTARLEQAYEGSAQVQWDSAADAQTAALGLTAGRGPWVVRVEAASRDAGDYRVGGHWRAEDGGRKVPGSYSDSNVGTLGLSWVGEHGYLGAAYTRQHAQYGLPGHTHADCHLHGIHRIHCHGHSDAHGHDHDHDAHAHEEVPQVDMRSHRWDVRGEWRHPIAGIEAVRLKGSHTRYGHDEIEEGQVATAFRNRAHELRWEVQHAPIAGWRGMVGLSNGQRNFSTQGAEAYVPATKTQKQALFVLEELQRGDWRWQAGLRYDRQHIHAPSLELTRKHQGASASLGTVWKFQPGWQASASFSHAARLPSAEELFANGLHMATNTWEIGNRQLKKETNNAWDLGVRKLSGNTTWQAQLYHYRIQGYIYGRTVHVDEGVQLQHYTQANARFTGAEGQVRQRLNRWMGVSLFGDVVRAKLASGGHLPRIPAARVGLRVDASWQGWEGQAEWVQVLRQNRTAAYETPTAGFGMLNLSASYRFADSPLQLTVKADNLNNRLGYASTSAMKHAAPLKGRNISVGLRMEF